MISASLQLYLVDLLYGSIIMRIEAKINYLY